MILVRAMFKSEEGIDVPRYIGFDCHGMNANDIIYKIESAIQFSENTYKTLAKDIVFCVTCSSVFLMNTYLPYTHKNINEVFGSFDRTAN